MWKSKFQLATEGYSCPMKQAKIEKESQSIPTIHQLRSMLNLRMLFGIFLVSISFISAYLISSSTNRMVTVWSSTIDLAPGMTITAADIERTQVQLPYNSELYLDGNSEIVGSHVIRKVGAAELIPAYSLSPEPISDLREVPIALSASQMPFGLKVGQLVDVYAIANEQFSSISASKKDSAEILLSNIAVNGIDMEASKLGGEVGVTLLVPKEWVTRIVSSMANSDFLLVKSP